MRRASNNELLEYDGDIVLSNLIVAINLGADYCAEHEQGIGDIKEYCGIPESGGDPGIAGRTVTIVPDELQLLDDNNRVALILNWVRWELDPPIWDTLSTELKRRDKEEIVTAWSDKDFGIVGYTPLACEFLRDLYRAFQEKDVAIWLGGGHVFRNAGLCLGIVSRISDKSKKAMLESDLANRKLRLDAHETGIEKRLRDAGLGFYALKPGRVLKSTRRGTVQTKYPVMFFLNPMEQRKYDCGWFTVEELDQWIEGRGPIIKDNK